MLLVESSTVGVDTVALFDTVDPTAASTLVTLLITEVAPAARSVLRVHVTVDPLGEQTNPPPAALTKVLDVEAHPRYAAGGPSGATAQVRAHGDFPVSDKGGFSESAPLTPNCAENGQESYEPPDTVCP